MGSINVDRMKVKNRSEEDIAFLNEKLQMIYKKLDFDGKGYVSKDDFVTWADNAAKIAGITKTARMNDAWMDAYDAYIGRSANFEEWRAYMQYKIMKDESIQETQLKINIPLFEAIDVHGKGFIGWDEYKAFVMAVGATEAEAHVGFGSIDANGDGVVSYEEFSSAYTKYHTEKDDTKYKHFWGEFQSNDTFLTEKLRRFYKKLDFQGRGFVTKEDSTTWMNKTAEMLGAKVTEGHWNAWADWFDKYFGDSKSFDEWKAHWLVLARNTRDIHEYASKMANTVFKILDIDGKDSITWNGYKAFIGPLGAHEGELHLGFWAVDINSDGVISLKEFADAFTKYFTDRTDSRSKHFFGEYRPADDFVVKKLRKLYTGIINSDGTVTKEDYLNMARKVAKISGTPLTDDYLKAWAAKYDSYLPGVKNFGDFKNRLLAAIDAPMCVSRFNEKNTLIWKLMDLNGNGIVSWDEYKAFVMGYNANEAEAHIGFGKVDTNHDGQLSYDEISTANARFFKDREDTIFKHFYGGWKEEDNK